MVDRQPPLSPADLPWTFFGRRVKPLALAASVANVAIIANFHEIPFTHPHALVIVAAILATLAFWFGWWLNKVPLVQVALLATVGVFGARAALAVMSIGWLSHMTMLSIAWMIAAGGAFLLERRAPHTVEPEAYGSGVK
jgi:hypothetical protein